MIVDAHHHLWRYEPVEYDWIGPGQTVLQRDYLLPELTAATAAAGVEGTVVVQARTTLEETTWLLDLADSTDLIRGVVGWVPLTEPTLGETLDALAGRPKLVGVREVLQGQPAGTLRDPRLRRGLGEVARRRLTYDLLIYDDQLPEALELVDAVPELPLIVDHLAKPKIAAGLFEPWATRLKELARREHVACKLSGVVTEADHARWTEAGLRPYLEAALEAFGPDRLLFGTDWPVCRLATEYETWTDLVRRFVAPLSPDERAAILGGSATRWYGLEA